MSTGGTEKKRNNVGSGEEGEAMEIQENSHFDDLKELTNRAIEDPEGTPDRYSIVELSPEVNYKVMTKERTKLLERLKSNPDIMSITELSEEIGRPAESVSRDLKILKNYGLIDLERNGRKKVPKLIRNKIVIAL